MKKVIFVITLLLLTSCSSNQASPNTIKIGLITPLTGDLASMGQMLKNTAVDYVESYPTWNGQTVELIIEDDQCNTQNAASATHKLINYDHVDIILADTCSGSSLAVAPIAADNDLLVLSSVSMSPLLSEEKNFFRNAPSAAVAGIVMAEAVVNHGFNRVALITENTDFTIGYRETFIANYTGQITSEQEYNSGISDFKTILTDLHESKPQAIVHFNQTPVSAGYLAKQNRELSLNYQIYSTDATQGTEFFDIAKDSADGHRIVVMNVDESNPKIASAIETYRQNHGELSYQYVHILALDRFEILRSAVNQVGTDTSSLINYLVEMPTYDGLSGPTAFDENGDSTIIPSVSVGNSTTRKFEVMK